jgi:hypothetical protein
LARTAEYDPRPIIDLVARLDHRVSPNISLNSLYWHFRPDACKVKRIFREVTLFVKDVT